MATLSTFATLSATIWIPDGNPECNDMITWWQPWVQLYYYLMATLSSTVLLPDGNPKYNGIITWRQPWVQRYYYLMGTMNSMIWLPDGIPECNGIVTWWQPWVQRYYYLMATLSATVLFPDGNPEFNDMITWRQPWVPPPSWMKIAACCCQLVSAPHSPENSTPLPGPLKLNLVWYWKCTLPLTPHVRLLVCRLAGWSICLS